MCVLSQPGWPGRAENQLAAIRHLVGAKHHAGPRDGIGGWTEPAIARAIRSGIASDGRALHWQGMIWDHASNWDKEDIRALVVYLPKDPGGAKSGAERTPAGR